MKKIIALLLILLTAVPVTFAEASDSAETSEPFGLVYDLGLVNKASEDSAIVTRGEAAAAAAKMSGTDINMFTESSFADVDSSNEYFNGICAAEALKIIDSGSSDYFRPNENITFKAALEMMIRLIGWYDYAADNGGIQAAAAKAGLLSDISAGQSDYLNFYQYKRLLLNTLNADVFTETSIGEFEITKGNNVLKAYLEITKLTGRITGCAYTLLSGESSLPDDGFILETDSLRYTMRSKKSKEELFSLLGHSVSVYYKEEDGDLTALSISPKSSEQTLIIDAADINLKSTAKNKIVYETAQGKETSVSISPAAYVVYNRSAHNSYTDEDFRIKDGNIKLISASGSKYEIVIITEYSYTMARDVNINKGFISDMYNLNSLDLNKDDVTLTENGAPLPLKEVNKADLILSLRDKNGKLISAERVLNRHVGIVDSVTRDECIIEGKTYRLSGYYKTLKALPNKPAEFSEITPGSLMCILTDKSGNAAAAVFVSSDTDMQYGLLIALKYESSVSETAVARMLTVSGKIKTYKFKNKPSLDSVSVTDVLDYFADNFGIGKNTKNMKIEKIVKFALNEDGVISRMDTELYNPQYEDYRNSVRKEFDKTEIVWSYEALSFSGKALVNSNTLMFAVPLNSEASDDYQLIRSSSLTSGGKYNVCAYDIARDGNAGAVIVYIDGGTKTAIDGWAPVYMIDEKGLMLDGEGNIVSVLYAYTLGGRTALVIKDGISTDGYEKGDLIRCGINFDGEVDNIETVLKKSDVKTPYKSHNSYTASYWFYAGKLIYREGNTVCVSFDENDENIAYFNVSQAASRCHYVYDGERNKISEASLTDLYGAESTDNPTYIMLYAWKGQVKDYFAFNNLD